MSYLHKIGVFCRLKEKICWHQIKRGEQSMIALLNHKSEPRLNTLYRCSFIDTRKERKIGSVMKAPPLRLAQTEGTKEGKKEIN